ncbi:signal peptidase II [Thiomicrorhabdus heinhorstiae]|uniref:Lipoprotein signal peptidase n=1 Tax=Thiomicrorhabdus heinhorstiae TaxID=2748010 RepID=A0ABS0BXS2_9GAMM|nr:signal peptidase II [Thiomicrorhabdus heinhorstiae]MBF6058593.1 signal peptidase II [Thiomicrorhabdus heinhorstiae]
MSFSSSTALKTLWVSVLVIIVDHLTKYLAVSYLSFGVPYEVMPYLNWTLVYNHGAAFSFLAEMGGWQRWFFAFLAIAMSVILLFWLKKLPAKLSIESVGINFILGGAVGNLIDRILSGRVTDFIDFYVGNWHYATFNVADVAITIGAILLIFNEFFWKKSS